MIYSYFDFGIKTAVFCCLVNTLAPLPIALESCSRAQTDRPVVKFTDLQSCYLFMVQHFFMVAFMLDMHGTSNSTAMKFFPTSTSYSIYNINEQKTIYFVSIDSNSINRPNFLEFSILSLLLILKRHGSSDGLFSALVFNRAI